MAAQVVGIKFGAALELLGCAAENVDRYGYQVALVDLRVYGFDTVISFLETLAFERLLEYGAVEKSVVLRAAESSEKLFVKPLYQLLGRDILDQFFAALSVFPTKFTETCSVGEDLAAGVRAACYNAKIEFQPLRL